jgi:hypothetical protein
MLKGMFVIVMSMLTLSIFAQNQEVPKPEFMNQPYGYLKNSSKLIPLAKETADIKAGIKMSYKFAGLSSNTEISVSSDISFLINAADASALTYITLYKLETTKKNRQVEVIALGVGKADTKEENVILYNIRQHAEDVYELVPAEELAKGEYAFITQLGSFTFSVE